MKAVIFFSGLAGLLIFGPPVWKSATHHHEISVVVRQAVDQRVAVRDHRVAVTDQSDCRYEAQRTFTSSAGSVEALRLTAGSGSLEVIGVDGLGEIRATGRACASHEEFLEALQITGETAGDALVLETHYPKWNGLSMGNRYARLDLKVEVPAGMAAEIVDGSGEMELSNLGTLFVTDGSGEAVLTGIRGDVTIKDGSGELAIRDVSGFVSVEDGSGEIILEDLASDVEVRDSSGEVVIRGVGGSVTVYDSSGEIQAQSVMGNFIVARDSSGGIQVRGIGGDFVVEQDGSGEIHYEDVAGAVDVPRKKR